MCCAQSHKPTTLMQKTRTNVTFTQSSRQATFTQQSIATFCTHTNQHQCKTNKQTTTTTTKPTCTQSNKQSTVLFFVFFNQRFQSRKPSTFMQTIQASTSLNSVIKKPKINTDKNTLYFRSRIHFQSSHLSKRYSFHICCISPY